jgi:ABC-type multidrug transport system ATPase subunit
MTIELDKVSKKFGQQWIFRQVSARFEAGRPAAIIGANGSGKSTLLKLISGIVSPNAGTVSYTLHGKAIAVDDIHRHISYTAPYLEVPEELTLSELISFHSEQRALHGISPAELIKQLDIPATKEIRNCSSGMKQRVKLALAFYTRSDLLLLDEPTANMDDHWKQWYRSLLAADTQTRTTIICSNDKEEYEMAEVKVTL